MRVMDAGWGMLAATRDLNCDFGTQSCLRRCSRWWLLCCVSVLYTLCTQYICVVSRSLSVPCPFLVRSLSVPRPLLGRCFARFSFCCNAVNAMIHNGCGPFHARPLARCKLAT